MLFALNGKMRRLFDDVVRRVMATLFSVEEVE